jgi:hypothetical protein
MAYADWKFAFDGHVYKQGDVTIDQWIEICDECGAGFSFVNPFRSAKDAKAIFRVLVSDQSERSREEAGKVIGAMSTDDFLALFEAVEDTSELPTEYEDGLPH